MLRLAAVLVGWLVAPVAVPVWFLAGVLERDLNISLDLTRRLLTGTLGKP